MSIGNENANWTVPDPPQNWEQVNTCVLMDIRDELQKLNGILNCQNFLDIPRILRGIRKNTYKPRRKR